MHYLLIVSFFFTFAVVITLNMEYIVSARKYRPMRFDDVVGQSALTTTLKNAVKSSKLAHAYLFCGPRGVGKTTCARIFAKAINCMSPTTDGEACGECESCKSFNEQRSLNIFELDAASNNSVENIKKLMEQTRVPPQVGKYKVFIIDEVHMLSTAAFNAFLKTLEEPPAHVIFILATTEKNKILPTIISRCQIYDFERMSVAGIMNHLKMVAAQEGITYEEQALEVIAEKADGGMRDALSIFDQTASFCQGNITYEKVLEDLNVLDVENYFRIVDLALENKVPDIMLLLTNLLNRGFDAGNLSTGLASHIRNVMVAKDEQTLPLLQASRNMVERYKAQAQKCPTKFLYKALTILNRCDVEYKQSSNKQLRVELALIEVAQITQPDDEPAGRSPRQLKILFKHLMTKAQSAAASQVAATVRPSSSTKEKRTNIPAMAAAAVAAADAISDTASDGTSSITTRLGSHNTLKPHIGLKLRTGSLGNTIASLRKQEQDALRSNEETIYNPYSEEQFTDEKLQAEWLQMCLRMPQKMRGIAESMKDIKPFISNYPTIDIPVGNALLLKQMLEIRGRIRATLANELHNAAIAINIRLAHDNEKGRYLSKEEVFKTLLSDVPALRRLCNELSLALE